MKRNFLLIRITEFRRGGGGGRGGGFIFQPRSQLAARKGDLALNFKTGSVICYMTIVN